MIQTENIIPVPEVKDTSALWSQVKGMGFDNAITTVTNSLISFCFKLVVAVLVFYIGKFLIKRIYGVVFKVMTHRHVDASLTTFVLSLVRITLYFVLIIIAIGILGVETSSFIAIFASAGVAIGMALSGTLQNFAIGVFILLLKPYKVGDFIEVQGFTGTVKSIQLFNTVINTVDNKAIILPNGVLSTSTINNYSLEDYRRVDWSISLAYGTDYEAARDAILGIVNSDVRIVRKYIEDDMAYREKVADEKKNTEYPAIMIEKKHGWLWSLFHRRGKSSPPPLTSPWTSLSHCLRKWNAHRLLDFRKWATVQLYSWSGFGRIHRITGMCFMILTSGFIKSCLRWGLNFLSPNLMCIWQNKTSEPAQKILNRL